MNQRNFAITVPANANGDRIKIQRITTDSIDQHAAIMQAFHQHVKANVIPDANGRYMVAHDPKMTNVFDHDMRLYGDIDSFGEMLFCLTMMSNFPGIVFPSPIIVHSTNVQLDPSFDMMEAIVEVVPN